MVFKPSSLQTPLQMDANVFFFSFLYSLKIKNIDPPNSKFHPKVNFFFSNPQKKV